MVVYDTNVHTIVPAQNAKNIQGIIHTLQQIRAGGSTALFGGVSQGAQGYKKMPVREQESLAFLVKAPAEDGPTQPSWPNYNKLSTTEYHCHLS